MTKLSIQEEITECDTYLQRVAVVVDAFAEGSITGEEADAIADKNDLAKQDLEAIYNVAYEQQAKVVTLMRMVQDKKISDTQKIEVVADVVINESIDTNIAEEIAKMQKLSIDEILSVIQLKRHGKKVSPEE